MEELEGMRAGKNSVRERGNAEEEKSAPGRVGGREGARKKESAKQRENE